MGREYHYFLSDCSTQNQAWFVKPNVSKALVVMHNCSVAAYIIMAMKHIIAHCADVIRTLASNYSLLYSIFTFSILLMIHVCIVIMADM